MVTINYQKAFDSVEVDFVWEAQTSTKYSSTHNKKMCEGQVDQVKLDTFGEEWNKATNSVHYFSRRAGGYYDAFATNGLAVALFHCASLVGKLARHTTQSRCSIFVFTFLFM